MIHLVTRVQGRIGAATSIIAVVGFAYMIGTIIGNLAVDSHRKAVEENDIAAGKPSETIKLLVRQAASKNKLILGTGNSAEILQQQIDEIKARQQAIKDELANDQAMKNSLK